MAPILEEMKKEYAGTLEVEFIDVWKNPDAGKQYGIEVIPTQIFYDASRQGTVPAYRLLCQGRHSGEVEGTRRGFENRKIVRNRTRLMEKLFTTLSHAVEGAPLIALSAAVAWGILSIILSPCHLASIPLIVGFISEQGKVTVKRAFWTSALFAVGILITIAAIGAITAAAGRMLGDVGRYGNYFVAVIFFVVGLHLLGVIPMPWSGPGQVGMKRKGCWPHSFSVCCLASRSAPARLLTWHRCWA